MIQIIQNWNRFVLRQLHQVRRDELHVPAFETSFCDRFTSPTKYTTSILTFEIQKVLSLSLRQGTREKKEDSEPAEESKRSVDVTVEGHEEEKPQKTEEDASDEKEEKNTTTTEKDVKEKPK